MRLVIFREQTNASQGEIIMNKKTLLILLCTLLSSNFASAFSFSCPSNEKEFVFRDGNLYTADGRGLSIDSAQMIDILETKTIPCTFVGESLVDVEVTTQLIQINHSYLGIAHETQFVCPKAELKPASCGE